MLSFLEGRSHRSPARSPALPIWPFKAFKLNIHGNEALHAVITASQGDMRTRKRCDIILSTEERDATAVASHLQVTLYFSTVAFDRPER